MNKEKKIIYKLYFEAPFRMFRGKGGSGSLEAV